MGKDIHIETLDIVYCTQMGHARAIAKQIAEQAEERGLEVQVHAIEDTSPQAVFEGNDPATHAVVLVASTFGNGGLPISGHSFLGRIALLDRKLLKSATYAIYGLGSSYYQRFCGGPRLLDEKFTGRGAKPVVPTAFGDMRHDRGYATTLEPWLEQLWAAFGL
jgi:sulfite reductase (NADPH) flavoprotein alpha-component